MDRTRLKAIYDLYKTNEYEDAYNMALNSDTEIREQIPGDIWKKIRW